MSNAARQKKQKKKKVCEQLTMKSYSDGRNQFMSLCITERRKKKRKKERNKQTNKGRKEKEKKKRKKKRKKEEDILNELKFH